MNKTIFIFYFSLFFSWTIFTRVLLPNNGQWDTICVLSSFKIILGVINYKNTSNISCWYSHPTINISITHNLCINIWLDQGFVFFAEVFSTSLVNGVFVALYSFSIFSILFVYLFFSFVCLNRFHFSNFNICCNCNFTCNDTFLQSTKP